MYTLIVASIDAGTFSPSRFNIDNNGIINLTYIVQKVLRRLLPVDISEMKSCKINCDYLVVVRLVVLR